MRRWMMLLALSLAGCGGFDEYYLHDGFVYEGAAEPPCGCASAPRSTPQSYVPGLPPTVSGSASSPPQSREPDLLR